VGLKLQLDKGGGKHYWPGAQAAGLLCCDLSCSSVLDFGFQLYHHIYPYVVWPYSIPTFADF